MIQYLFIYGTLTPDRAPDEISETVKKLNFIGEGFVRGRLYDAGQYPAAILGNLGRIFGYVYKLPSNGNVLRKIDQYEEYDPQDQVESLYIRKRTNVYLGDKTLSSWIYEYNQDVSNLPLIKNGRYSSVYLAA